MSNELLTPEEARELVSIEEMSILGQSGSIAHLVGQIQKRTAEAQHARDEERFKNDREHTSHLVDDVIRLEAELAELKKARLDSPYVVDTLLAIMSFASYSGLGLEEYYETPVEGYTSEGMEQALDVVSQILSLFNERRKINH